MTTRPSVLVTGAFGLVGTAVVADLADRGHTVAATDLDLPAHRRRAGKMITERPRVAVHWADLIRAADVDRLIRSVSPSTIVHLAAIIPPFCYARRELAHQVNVEATARLVKAATSMAVPPRFVLASSVAVHGARNPHRNAGLLTTATARQPSDLYGSHKVAAEDLVTNSDLDWVVLRLGGVLTAQPRWTIDRNLVFFEAVLPADGHIHTVDVRDVARAFAAATVTMRTREVFLIGGDGTHRTTQRTISTDAAAAMGLRGGLPAGRPGDPADDRAWFATDWMDTSDAQDVLQFQQHSQPDMYAQLRATIGWRRLLLRVLAPALRLYLRRRSPYRRMPGRYADPWTIIEQRWGDPRPDEAH
jgi:nucleoside-diphosphate-sugar epimerase